MKKSNSPALYSLIFGLLALFSPQWASAQLIGKITNTQNEPIPFANVYIEGTTQGTTANTEGGYQLDIPKGRYKIVFQALGYAKKVETINIVNKLVLNITLQASEIELSEFVVKSNAEDPAYPIIRKAIEMRKVYRDQVPAFSCDVYIKGVQKLVDAPKKLMGRDVGDLDGTIDTITRSGILYLSETISKYYVDGSKKREELVSSKVSGNANGFGFNRATLFDFSFYENHIEIGRQILSPIADNALTYYRYKLVSTIKEKSGADVYKIEVIPKRKEDPTFAGFIYIVDNQWNIYSTDLFVTGKSIQQPILDTMYFKQNFVQVDKTWRLFSQILDFKLQIFSLKIKGDFTGVYSNYNLTPQYDKRFFNNELFKASRGKDDNLLSKWDTIRPIPLTLEERMDYIKKDSLQLVRRSKTYIDSIQKKQNKFTFTSAITGYTYTDILKNQSFTVTSPLTTIAFNPVQGGNIGMIGIYEKRFGEPFEPYKKSFSLIPIISYGFAEKKLRANFSTKYLFNRFNYAQLSVDGGRKMEQFNEQQPIGMMIAELYALYGKKHYYHVYDKTFLKLSYSQELFNGLKGLLELETAKRSPLSINSQFSFTKKEREYNPNEPFNVNQPNGFQWNGLQNAHTIKIGLTWVPAQKYSTYPQFKDIEGSRYPTFSVFYKKAIALGKNAVDYDAIQVKIQKKSLTMGLWGYSEINAQYGQFLNKKAVQFVDYQHFNGNQTFISNKLNYMEGFFALPYYQYSTPNAYFMAHWQHHFEGFIFDKIPLIRRLGFKEVLRVAYLNTPELKNYTELGFGIDNIGFKLFRFIRTDVNWQYINGQWNRKPQVRLGITLGL